MRVLIVGLGALGTRVAPLMKEHNLTLADYDVVMKENLERQPLYKETDIGKSKVEAARNNLNLQCRTLAEPFQPEMVENHDCIIDCTDNLQVRFQLNDAALSAGIPLVIATASKNHGFVFPVRGKPCWQCIALGKTSQEDCTTDIHPETLDAVAKLEVDLAFASSAAPVLYMIHGTEKREIRVMQNPNCEACKGNFNHLKPAFSVGFCQGTKKLQARPTVPKQINLEKLDGEVLEKYSTAIKLRLAEGTVTVHKHGLIEFENVPEPIARAYSQRLL